MTAFLARTRSVSPRVRVPLALFVVLLVANLVALPSFISPHYLPATLAGFAPLALAAMASTPAILTGGIDLSISPTVILVNIFIVHILVAHSWSAAVLLIPLSLGIGAGVGVLLGAAIAFARLPAILVTLSGLFVLSGVDMKILPNPVAAKLGWLAHLGTTVGPVPGAVLTIGVPLLVWLLIARGPFGLAVRAVGSSDGAALSAGVDVTSVRVIAYTMGGILAGVGGIAYTVLTRSADASTAQQYTVLAIAAVAVGGTSLTGGKGGLGASVIGAGCIFLIQELLTAYHVSVFWLNVAYGGMLLAAIVVGARGSTMRLRSAT